MEPKQRTCFVISPIGPENSPIRQAANDFLELLVEPALEKYGFSVHRADKIAHPTSITTDIVKLVQEADLCLIDLTNSNPNVFYECGRRHETGKPFIQLVAKGQEAALPFDVSGIRTVVYDVSSTRSARESVMKLQEFIDSLVGSGFSAKTSGDSLGSIAQGIERIERKVNQLLSATGGSSPVKPASQESEDGEDPIKMLMASPRKTYLALLRKGRLDDAYALLDRVKRAGPDEYPAAISLLVSMGHEQAFIRMENDLQDALGNSKIAGDRDELVTTLVEGAKKYFENLGESRKGCDYLSALYDRISSSAHFSDKTKSFVANKIGMLAWIVDDYAICIKYTKLAISICSEPSYYYNLALVYATTNEEEELHETLRLLSKMSGLDSDHTALLRKYGYTS